MKNKKISQFAIRGFIIPILLIGLVIIGVLQWINFHLGYIAYLITSVLVIFAFQYKYIIQIKNWLIQGVILIFIAVFIEGFIKQNNYLMSMGIYLLGIIISIIVNYKIFIMRNNFVLNSLYETKVN